MKKDFTVFTIHDQIKIYNLGFKRIKFERFLELFSHLTLVPKKGGIRTQVNIVTRSEGHKSGLMSP